MNETSACRHDHEAQRATISDPRYSHSTVRSLGTIWEHTIWTYRHDPASPTGVKLWDDAPSGDARCEACCANYRPHCGPIRGALARQEGF